MRLNYAQVEALVDKIENSQQVKVKEWKPSEEEKKKAREAWKTWASIPKKFRKILDTGYRKTTPKKFLEVFRKYPKTKVGLSRNEIRTQIHLASIDAKDLAELSKKLGINL